MTRKFWIGAVMALVVALALPAADKPDFSGSWKLNSARSDFGPMPPPDKWDMVVEHKDPSLKVKTTMANAQMGERNDEAEYATDGTEKANGATTAVVTWEGALIVFKTSRKVNMQGEQVEIKGEEKWSLSEDGKTLTVDAKLTAPMGEFQMKRVLDKQ
ncbi:MAG TPA: hypothetical protein PLF84_10180 [Bryobacteraceae bacterium]|nr:hypothetical protein [Bryobacterales bacterium]HRJ19403.1 hypothetical protein [Bryobacteraceae bacterium]